MAIAQRFGKSDTTIRAALKHADDISNSGEDTTKVHRREKTPTGQIAAPVR